MPRVEARRLGRVLLYGSLACGLGLAVMAPGMGSRQATVSAPDEKWLRLGRVIIAKYLESLPEAASEGALHELTALSPAQLKKTLDWLPIEPEQRPLTLGDTGLDKAGALFAALLEASLTGYNAAPLPELPRLFQQLPLAKDDSLRLHLLMACARHAAVENDTAIELEMLAAAARHPRAGWEHLAVLIETAASERQTAAAVEVLQDWLDDPPSAATTIEHERARAALARLLLLDNQAANAWAMLQPLLNNATAPADSTLELAWNAAAGAGQTASMVKPLEAGLQPHPPHQLHWRELADAPPPAPAYLTGLRRLATACQAAGNEARAVEMHLHLAWLEHPRHLLSVLPAAVGLDRLGEVLDLLERLDEERPDPAGAHAFTLAALAMEQGQTESARALLEARLARHPQDLAATRLLLRVRADTLPLLQAVMLWKQHLRRHPGDSGAHHHICDLWQRARQPRAAVNHLLSLSPSQASPSLRLRLAETAIAARHAPALVTALERLRAAGETLPPELTAAGAELLQASGLSRYP